MSATVKIEEVNSAESDDNLEVRRSTSRSVQTYRPHKRAHMAENNGRTPKRRRASHVGGSQVSTRSMTSAVNSSVSQALVHCTDCSNNLCPNNPNNNVAAERDQSLQIDPEVVVISDSDSEVDVFSNSDSNSRDEANSGESQAQTSNPTLDREDYDDLMEAARSFAHFMRHALTITINPHLPGVRLLTDGAAPSQRFMWLRQQADAENRRRRSTSGSSSIQYDPPFLRIVENSVPTEVPDPRHRTCVAKVIISRFTVLYEYKESSNTGQRSCVVCINEFRQNQLVRRLPCMHIFHKDCVDRWIHVGMKCPICRYDLLIEFSRYHHRRHHGHSHGNRSE